MQNHKNSCSGCKEIFHNHGQCLYIVITGTMCPRAGEIIGLNQQNDNRMYTDFGKQYMVKLYSEILELFASLKVRTIPVV